MKREKNEYSGSDPIKDIDYIGNAIKLGVRGFVRICIETCARGCFCAWKCRFRKKAC